MGQLVKEIAALQNYEEFASLNWKGSFEDYLDLVKKNPDVTRHIGVLFHQIQIVFERSLPIKRGKFLIILKRRNFFY